jgi:diguanylate cyclase (GGDEF)-like protein/PAS domain S-box-containing protein
MPYGLRSIRRRIIALSLILAALLFGAVLHTEGRVREVVSQSQEGVARQQAFTAGFAELKNTVYSMEGGLYRYAVLQDDSARAGVERLLREIGQRSAMLHDSSVLADDDDVQRSFDTLLTALGLLEREVQELLEIIGTLERRFPASPIITDKLYPLNVAFATALDEAVLRVEVETGGGFARDMLHRLQDVRYLWSQQISTVRMYIANRSGVFGSPEAGMQQQLNAHGEYLHEIRRHLDELQGQAKVAQMSLLLDSLNDIDVIIDDYEQHFSKVVTIYESGSWRGDVAELRYTIQPLLIEVRRGFGAIESSLGELGSQGVMGSLRLAEELTAFLWRVTGVVVVLLLLAYLAYELTIRRPIDQVIMALRALGKGEAYTPLIKTSAYETETLLHAFRDMQNQVHGREMRLASILDNASDGIITINKSGIIETFNVAAETLFRYQAEEVIGQKVNLLMPHPLREEHDGYIRRYIETGEQRIIGNEMNVNAQRKDGTVFPMSIKVGEMMLDGERYFTAIVSDISERKAMLDHLRHLAEHDSLTGLYNRQYFTDELERTMQRSMRQKGLNCALLYIDLDNFKFVNDTLGHLAGDCVLIEVASLITNRTRKSDLIARLGGDEFAVLLYDVELEQAQSTAESYRQMMTDYTFRYEGRVVDIGCSIGLAMFERDVESREDLMARADIACHMAKRSGRNCVHLYRADDRANMDTMFADMGWARNIKQAIEQDGFVFALQPIVTIPSRSVVSYELLLRMRGEGREIIMPSGFMPSAERFGLILEIDRWVVRNAIGLLSSGVIEPSARLSVNLSAMAVGDQEVLHLITAGLDQYGIDPRRLTFEITETIAMADLSAAVDFLASLRALGCATALDDFGVGYSSFAYLKDLPVDYVKIDGSFVRDIAKDTVQLAMVKSMNEIAHAMGKRTVAEYVDNDEVLRLLGEIGVDFAQGYLTGKPRLVDAPADI